MSLQAPFELFLSIVLTWIFLLVYLEYQTISSLILLGKSPHLNDRALEGICLLDLY